MGNWSVLKKRERMVCKVLTLNYLKCQPGTRIGVTAIKAQERRCRVHRRLLQFGPDTHPSCLHLTSNQQQLENQTAYVVTNAIVVSS